MSAPDSRAIFEAVLNGSCQSIALAGLAWILLKSAPGLSAAIRYAVWCATLAAALVLPAAQVIASWPGAPAPAVEIRSVPATWTAVADEGGAAPEFRVFPITVPGGWPARAFFVAWLLGAGLFAGRLAWGVRRLQQLKADAEAPAEALRRWTERWTGEVGPGRRARLRVSRQIQLPMTAGMTDPAILFPAALAERMTEQDARAIWLHETAHVRRRDDWTKLGQRVVEAALFFNPAVLWVGRKLQLERELACDDWVVRRTGQPRRYATCLAKLAEFASDEARAAPALSMASGKKEIFRRVEMLLYKDRQKHSRGRKIAGVFTLVLLGAGAVSLSLMSPLFVMAQAPIAVEREAEAAPPVPPVPPAPPAPAERAQATAGTLIPAPPAPPAPVAAPQAPARPAPAPEANPEPATEAERRALREATRANREEIRRLSEEIRQQVNEQIRPQAEEIRRLGEQIREKVEQQIKPITERTRELASELSKQALAEPRNEEAIEKLQRQIEELSEKAVKAAETDIRALEEKIRAHEFNIKPPEEQIRKLEELIRKQETELREVERKFRQRRGGEPGEPEASPRESPIL
ncbi:MAG: hypothetical protein KIT09_18585 [Bryobacteraceae bacterium]|nr:hypothetical protein [Bryobacteraceae bacterium]